MVREVGKPVTEARGEVARGVAILRYYAQAALAPDGETLPASEPDQLLLARHVPVGVRRPAHPDRHVPRQQRLGEFGGRQRLAVRRGGSLRVVPQDRHPPGHLAAIPR